MPAARILFGLFRRIAAAGYLRSRAQLAALVLTALAASLFLPGPWDASRAQAAKEDQQSPRELTELRSAKTKTTREPDGRLKTTLSAQSLHYLDEDDKWKDVDATFKTSSKTGAKWESGENRFSVELADKAKHGFVTLRTADGDFALSLEGSSDSAAGVKAKDNTIVFKDVLKDVDIEYVLLPDGLKESIVLKAAGAPSEYRFRLEPEEGEEWRTEKRAGGVWFFHEQASEPAFVLPEPIVGDSKALPPDAGRDAWTATPGKASMEVKREGDGAFSVKLRIDETWLESADRVYPVVLDPTWLVQPDWQDGDYNTTSGGPPDTATLPLRTGRDGAGSPKYASVMSFDLGVLPPGARILEARLNLYLNACFPLPCSGGSHTGDVELRRLTSGWSPATPWSAVTKDPALLDKISFTTTPTLGWKFWGSGAFTQSVQGMVNGSISNLGFIVEKNGGNDNTQYRWRSSRWSDPTFVPTMSVYWVADGVQVSPSMHTHANGAELTWQHFAGGTSAYADAVLDDNPVGYWRMDEAADIFAWDWSQQDNVGVIQDAAGVVRAEAGPLADYNLSTRFPGTQNGFVKVARDPSLQVNDTFTLEAWLKRSDLTARDMAIFNDFGSGFWLRLNYANKIELLANGNGAPIAASTSTVSDTNWHHIAATKAGATVKIYIDGVDVTGTVTNQTLASSGLALHIGQTDGFEQPFFGSIDEAALYPTALSATRVQAHLAAAPTPMPGFDRFEIHRSAVPNFTPSATTLISKIGDVAIQTYRDTSARASSTFYYEVVTVTAEGSFSSNEVKAELPAAGTAALTVQPTYIHSSASATHISSGAPDSEAGASTVLTVGSAGSNHTRALLSFELGAVPSLPTSATITSAQLQLYALGTTPAVSAHRLSAMWWHAGTTWNHREKSSNLPWQTPGGDFDSASAATSAGGSGLHWDSWSITSLVQDWVKGDKAQLGVLLKFGSENGSQSTLSWASESYTGSAALRPKLVVTYPDPVQIVSPTVAVSQPQAAESVKGTVTVKAGALDDGRVATVEFFLDGNPLGAPDTTAPYETSWNTTSASRGSHTLTAKASDEAGNQTTSPGVAVTVSNSAAPTTSITSATAGTGGNWTVNASASDDIGLSKVEFYVDGDRFATDSASPWSATLATLAFPAYDGSRILTTRAYDADGNVTTSTNHPITVANATGSKYKATISTANVPLEQRFEPGGGSQEGAPLTVSLTNTSTVSWPTAEIKLRYRWLSADSPPAVSDSANVSIGADLAAGQQRNVSVTVDPPALPTGVYRARYQLRIDLYDTGASSYFAAKGNQPYESWVTVTRKVVDELGLERYQQYDGEDLGGGFDHALNLANGNNVLQWVPFSQPGRGLNTVVTMTYNSLEHGSVSPLGNNWSLAISSLTPFGLPLDVHPNAADTAAGRTQKWVGFTDGDGSYHVFTGNAAGTYYAAPPGVHLYLKSIAGGWELWKPDRTKFVYGEAGFPTTVADANGNELTITTAAPAAGEDAYELAKRVTIVKDASLREFNLTYFTKAETPTPAMRGKLKRLSDHVGHALEFSYYQDGNLRSIREKGGPGDDGMPTPDRELFLAYTASTTGGVNTDYTTPAIATLAGRQNPDPATVQSPKLYSLIDFRGKETSFKYFTGDWRVTERKNRTPATTTFSYDTGARKTTVTMPLSRVWDYTLDTEGRVTRVNDPVNTQDTTIEWADQTTPNEVANVVRKVTQPSGEFVEYAYNANGYKTDEWDELRNHQTFVYENIAVDGNDGAANWPLGRSIPHLSQLTSLVKPVGNATTGNPNDYRWQFAYTPTGLVDTITDPLGNITDNAWNANGTLAAQTLPANGDGITRTTTFDSYDANGLVTQMTDAAGGLTRVGYAANGNLLWLQDPQHSGNSGTPASDYRSEHFYDAHGRAVSSSQPKSTAAARGLLVWEGQAYDAGDNVLSESGPHFGRGDGRNGALQTTTFDDMGRPLLVTGPRAAADGGPVKTKTEYDDAGRVSKVTKPKGVDSAPANDYATETAYDLLDRENTITVHALDPANTRITNHCYDDAGDLRSVTGPKGAASFTSCLDPAATPYVYTTATHTTKFEYDKAHRQLKTTNAAGQTSETSYDENGQAKTETDELGKVTTIVYEERGLKLKTVEPFDTGRTLTTISEYDPLGNLKRLISPRAFDAAGGQPYTDYVESYAYDALERLTKTTLPVGQGANAYFGTALADGPLAYWRFGSGGTDETSPPSDATVYGGSLGQPGALAGDPDGSMSCNGAAMCAYVSEENETNPYWSLSIEAWVKTSSTAEQTIFGHNNHGVRLWAQGGGFHFKWTTDINGNGWTVGTPGGYADGSWHHVVAVFENWTGTIRIYVDGIEKGSFSQGGAGSVYYSTSAASIGGDWGNQSNFTGSLDELAFYGSALTATQVATHYAARVHQPLPQAYRHQAYNANGNTIWTSLPTLTSASNAVTEQEKTSLTYWDTGSIYSSQDPAKPKVRFDYTPEGWQSARIPEYTWVAGWLDFSQQMAWDYLPDGLQRGLRDEGEGRALYSYDQNSNRTQAKEASGLVSPGQEPLPIDLSYNGFDELSKVRSPKLGASGTYLGTTLAYDLHGNTSQLVDNREENAGGSQTAAGRGHTYSYNAIDQPATQTDDFATTSTSDDEQLTYTYKQTGALDTQTLKKNSSGSWVDEQSSVRTYFENGLLKTLTNRNGTGALIEEHTLSYIKDGVYLNGNRVSDSFYLKGPDSSPTVPCYWFACTATWAYDARERVTIENPGTGQTRAFALDVQGNVTQESAGSSTIRTYSGQQLQTQTQGGVLTRFLYDALGSLDCQVKSLHTGTTCPAGGHTNLIEDNVYDHKSRLIGYRYYNGAPTASKRSEYTNDPLDRPVKQVETSSGQTTTYDFTYIGVTSALSKEVLSGGTSATKRYAYDAFGNRSTIAEDKSGQLNRYSYLYDPHSSVSLLIDQSNVVKESYGYQAYGAANAALTRTASGFDNKTNPYRYSGKRLDSGSGTYDMGARRYSASTGRFLQYDLFADALENLGLAEDPLTQNRYALAGGNPISFVEVDGHWAIFYDSGGTQFQTCGGVPGCLGSEPDISLGEVGGFLYEVSGAKDIEECLRGSLSSCTWAVAGLTPLGKGVRAAQRASRSLRHIDSERIENEYLERAYSRLFQDTDEFPGGTAGMLRIEAWTGTPIKSRTGHLQKATSEARHLRKLLRGKHGDLEDFDRQVAEALLKDLQRAITLFHKKRPGGYRP